MKWLGDNPYYRTSENGQIRLVKAALDGVPTYELWVKHAGLWDQCMTRLTQSAASRFAEDEPALLAKVLAARPTISYSDASGWVPNPRKRRKRVTLL